MKEYLAKEPVKYKGICVNRAMEIPVQIYQRRRYQKRTTLQFARQISRLIAIIFKRFGFGVFWRFQARNTYHCMEAYKGKKIVVICDHTGHVEQMTVSLLDRFKKDDILLLTINSDVYQHLKDQFPACLNVSKSVYYCRFRNIPNYYRYYQKISQSVGINDSLFKLYLFSGVCSVLQSIEYYDDFFNITKPSAVMTMSDKHSNEYAITMSARKHNIMTYTNQHSHFSILAAYLPIASDKIFVWGSKSKEQLIEAEIPQEKIIISGNTKFDKVYSYYLPRRNEIRKDFQSKFGFQNCVPTITYLCPGIFPPVFPPKEAFEFFKCFCQAFEYPVNVLLKLRPRLITDKKLYGTWLKELEIQSDVPVLQDEDLYTILTVSDIIVTTISGAGLEAIGFGIPTIVLNTIEGFDVRKYASFIDDAIECTTPDEFQASFAELLSNEEKYQSECNRLREVRKQYFRNSEEFNSSKFIKEYIMTQECRPTFRPL